MPGRRAHRGRVLDTITASTILAHQHVSQNEMVPCLCFFANDLSAFVCNDTDHRPKPKEKSAAPPTCRDRDLVLTCSRRATCSTRYHPHLVESELQATLDEDLASRVHAFGRPIVAPTCERGVSAPSVCAMSELKKIGEKFFPVTECCAARRCAGPAGPAAPPAAPPPPAARPRPGDSRLYHAARANKADARRTCLTMWYQ